MCVIKYYTLSPKLVWRTLGFSACFLLVLGATSFGFGMKLLEYAEKAEITPLFAGIPMVAAGIVGIVAALSKKKWAVTTYAILCVIVSMLSIHMNYRFMGKELPSLSRYEKQCNTKPKDQYHCDQYLSTILLCGVSVLMLPVFLTGFLACLAARRLLQETDCHVIWFTCSKVEPEQHRPTNARQTTRNKQRNKQIGLLKYKKSTEKIYENNEINPHKEFLPRIPDFKDLAGNSNNPGYPASVINNGEYSDMIGRSGTSNREFEADPRDLCGTLDLGLYKNVDHRNPEEYYGRAAEEWIESMVDNFYSTRLRLYGVSDDDEIDDEPDQEFALKSNEKQQPFLQNGDLLDISTNETSSPKKSEISKILEENILSSNINTDPNNKQYDVNSTTENQSEASAKSCGPLSKDTDTTSIIPLYDVSCTHDQGVPEATPLGLITPIGDLSPTGALYFEFEKVASAHARKNWVEFDRMA